uniref:lysosomal acid glucosylceramidase-like n=1 Tax=Styela clava TaxID=7725 RepID=UPI001939D0E9|nr:lysosomal acid glucosylceramidase-like [Styela clava]
MYRLYIFLVNTFLLLGATTSTPCVVRKYGSDSSVCVCNSTYCDTLNKTFPGKGKLLVLTSSMSGNRFHQQFYDLEYLHENFKKDSSVNIIINTTKFYQAIKGFGGALTDSASINIMSLSTKSRDNLLKSYFGKGSIEYNLIRIPMAGCDYSTREYTYLDKPNDFNLSTFALAMEDIKFKIPLLKQIFSMTMKNISLYASPWTAPAWMKTSGDEIGIGGLQGKAGDKYHKTWAEYFTRFFDEYKKEGINFWGVTMQNEPSNGLVIAAKWQAMGWTPEQQKDFVKTDLGPMLEKKGYGNIKLMIHDDQRVFLPAWPKEVLSDPSAAKYVSGIGVHWYWDWLIGPEKLNITHNLFPDKFILATEACVKHPPTESIGNWEMGEKYSNDILDNLNNWAVGWVDWNMCLDMQGGPNWVKNFDNSPIIVNATADEFYKQPMFYHLGHFSKYINENSVRVHSQSDQQLKIKYTAVFRKDGYTVMVVLNKEDTDVSFTVSVHGSSKNVNFNAVVPKRSIQTYIW